MDPHGLNRGIACGETIDDGVTMENILELIQCDYVVRHAKQTMWYFEGAIEDLFICVCVSK